MEEFRRGKEYGQEHLDKVLRFINETYGFNLFSYRQSFVFRHLRSRIVETKSRDFSAYMVFLKNNPGELELLLKSLSVNVTQFFRDPEVFTAFRQGPLAELIKRKEKNSLKSIRVWSAGCACGQEAYSLAIMMREVLGKRSDFSVKILATDVNSEFLQRAKIGEYDEKDLKKVDKKILEKYFQRVYNGKYSINDEIRKMVRFTKQNLISDSEMKFMDIIFCRNVLIYFSGEQQEILFNKFYQALNSLGYLVIAKVEGLKNKNLFINLDARNKIFQKIG